MQVVLPDLKVLLQVTHSLVVARIHQCLPFVHVLLKLRALALLIDELLREQVLPP